MSDLQLIPALWFFVGVLVLSLFDLSLPRGDTIGVGGALGVALVVLQGPLIALPIGTLGLAVAFLVRERRLGREASRADILADTFALAIACLSWVPVQQLSRPLIQCVLVGVVYLATELLTSQVLSARRSRRALLGQLRGAVYMQAPLLLAQLSAAVLLVVIYPTMGAWGILLTVALLLLIRQSYALLISVKESYARTVRVLVESADPRTKTGPGHAYRVARIARGIGQECGLAVREVEQLGFAAMLHDVGAVDAEEGLNSVKSSEILADVSYFDPVNRVLSVVEGDLQEDGSDQVLLAGFIVALASDIDDSEFSQPAPAPGSLLAPRLSTVVPAKLRARAVAAAVKLGHGIPAMP